EFFAEPLQTLLDPHLSGGVTGTRRWEQPTEHRSMSPCRSCAAQPPARWHIVGCKASFTHTHDRVSGRGYLARPRRSMPKEAAAARRLARAIAGRGSG